MRSNNAFELLFTFKPINCIDGKFARNLKLKSLL